MTPRVSVIFWGTTAASVFLLGAIWALKDRVASGSAGPQDFAYFTIAGLGLLATTFVAGRIVFVLGRMRRLAKQRDRPGTGYEGDFLP